MDSKATENLKKLREFPLSGGKVVKAEWFEHVADALGKSPEPQWSGLGSFYRVVIKLYPTEQSDITVMMYLPEPEVWNGKFLGTGTGGSAGIVSETDAVRGFSRGYASANTDMGTTPDPDDCIGLPERWADFGHRATHLMSVEGKRLTEYFYGRQPERSYFFGGSTGGQQGLSEAQRYPEDYDGIVCFSPAHDRVRLHSFFIWNWQQLHGRKDALFTQEQSQKWNESIIKAYGKFCGSNEADAFLAYPGRVKENPMDSPALKQDIAEQLTDGQREALRAIYDGPKDPVTGERIIPGLLPGMEAEDTSLVKYYDKDKFAHGLFYLFRWIWGKDFDFFKFDFHKDLQYAIERLSPVLDAADPNLDAFKSRGGKLLVVGAGVDAIIPYTGFMEYYLKAAELQGGLEKTKEFFRFIMMPGLAHVLGGPGVQDAGYLGLPDVPRDPEHDALCAMERWVEQGTAPERLLGTCFKDKKSFTGFDHSRPAYAYPNIAEFTGGNPKDPERYRPVEDANAY